METAYYFAQHFAVYVKIMKSLLPVMCLLRQLFLCTSALWINEALCHLILSVNTHELSQYIKVWSVVDDQDKIRFSWDHKYRIVQPQPSAKNVQQKYKFACNAD